VPAQLTEGAPKVEEPGASRTPDAFHRTTTACNGRWILDECDTCGKRRKRWYGCHSPRCTRPGCRQSVATSRGKRIYERLGALEAVPWVAVVLTLPPGPREASIRPEERLELRREAWRVVAAWVAWWCFRGAVKPGELGGVVLFHPCGEDPERWAPHFNVLIPLQALRPSGSTRKGRYHEASDIAFRLAIEDLRGRWAKVCRAYGYVGMHAVQIRYEARPTQEARIHAARYFGRGFAEWAPGLQRPTYYGTLRALRALPGGEPEAWPFSPGRCECGGDWVSIAAMDANGVWRPTVRRGEDARAGPDPPDVF